MSESAKKLVKAIRQIVDTGSEVFPATVVSVDKSNDTCIVEFDELQIGDVRIKATIEDQAKGVKLYPVPQSVVLVQRIVLGVNADYFITMFSEVEEVRVLIGELVFKTNEEGVLIKKGDDSLKDILKLTIEAVQQITVLYGNPPNYQKLETAIEKLNNLFL